MNEIEIRDGLFELFPPDESGDWDDVLRRSRPRWRAHRVGLVALATIVAALAVGSALALSGRFGNLFHGDPVNDLSPRERFLLSELDLKGRVELIAERGSTAFYVIRRRDGVRCYSIGDIRKHLTPAQKEMQVRFGSTGCIDPHLFPSRELPVLDYSFYSYQARDRVVKLAGLRGFAVDAVAEIGVIGRDNEIVFRLPVEDNVYSSGKRGFAGAKGIVALDEDGKVLWVRCTAVGRGGGSQFPSGGCGKYKNSPPPKQRASPRVNRPQPPSGPVVAQRGSAAGVSVIVRGPDITADFSGISAETRRLLVSKHGRVVLGCFKLVSIGGTTNTSGGYFTKDFGAVVRVRPRSSGIGPRVQTAPFDACTATGMYGHSWNDARGTHDLIEIPLTPRGRRYLAERATARDLAWLARARVFHDIRYARPVPAAGEVAQVLGAHVVPLETPAATPPAGKLGVWTGEPRRVVLVEVAPTGRRLYLELRDGVIYRMNLLGLASVL
jgi:hypothetical protein